MSEALLDGIAQARTLTHEWIRTMAATHEAAPVFRESAQCDLERWPGMALPGTYNIAMLSRLIGDGLDSDPECQSAMADWILAKRRAEGSWWLDGMDPADTFKKTDAEETRFYLIGHISNYALGALEALDRSLPVPDFSRRYLDLEKMESWMARRDWDDPWQEGNNMVNLGSFLLLLREDDKTREAAIGALDWLIAWHIDNSNPNTGFWGNRQETERDLLHAMAGATHNYHLFYKLGRPVPHLDKAVDYCLTQPPDVVSACIDADLVDILANAAFLTDHRKDEVVEWLTEIGHALLAFQNGDGGFADTMEGTRRFDGWTTGYSEPQGISNGFATFFRWIALAMIARVLNPEDHDWGFRHMVGLGYFKHR